MKTLFTIGVTRQGFRCVLFEDSNAGMVSTKHRENSGVANYKVVSRDFTFFRTLPFKVFDRIGLQSKPDF
jgi:hypothetical protein